MEETPSGSPRNSIMTTIKEILDEEFVQLKLSRDLRLGKNISRPAPENSLVGLAFSGGGIRSATFNLGILQALAKSQTLLGVFVRSASG